MPTSVLYAQGNPLELLYTLWEDCTGHEVDGPAPQLCRKFLAAPAFVISAVIFLRVSGLQSPSFAMGSGSFRDAPKQRVGKGVT